MRFDGGQAVLPLAVNTFHRLLAGELVERQATAHLLFEFSALQRASNEATNPGWFRGLQLFAQGEVINAFNEDAEIGFNTGVLTHLNDASLKRFNPMAGDVPVEGVHWKKGSLFGLPTSAATPSSVTAHYQLPRTYRVSFGVRF